MHRVALRSLACLAWVAAACAGEPEPMPASEVGQRLASWDAGIRNGVLRNARWSEDGARLSFDWQERDGAVTRREVDCATGSLRVAATEAVAADSPKAAPRRSSWEKAGRSLGTSREGWTSPDRRWRLRVDTGSLYLESMAPGGVMRQLDASSTTAGEWTGTPAWSPDGRHFAIWRTPKVETRRLSVREAATGRVTTLPYPVAGDPLAVGQAWVFEAESGRGSAVPTELTGPTYSTARLDWTADGTRLRTEYIRRGFTGFGVLEFDTRSWTWRKALEESGAGFCYAFGLRFRHDLDADTALWVSERSGWSHLYRVDLRSGQVLNAVTSGAWVMRRVIGVDPKAGAVLFEALGRIPGENPYQAHLCRVNLDGSGLVDLTPGDAHHEFNLSPCGRHVLDIASRADLPPVFTLRRTSDGSALATLGEADISQAKLAGWSPPIRFRAKDRNGKFDIWGLIHRPKPFDPSKRYPVLERIYAGPHDAFTPVAFAPWWDHAVREPNLNGFYVVQIDGLGTGNRGREFHQRAWRDLRDAGLPDRIGWMRAAARTEPQMDLSRVGIFGGSAGGQSTVFALLDHGDFYRAGAADCGCYDNRVDKLWWNEQWLGWPVGEAYDRNRCANFARQLTRPLLMTVGEIDTNVDPRSSSELRDALVAAGKGHLVDYRVVPGAGHGAGELDEPRQARLGFFLRHLGGPLPR